MWIKRIKWKYSVLFIRHTFGLRSKKLWYLNLSSSTSFSLTSCSIRDLEESNHLWSINTHLIKKKNSTGVSWLQLFLGVHQTTCFQSKTHLTPGWFWPYPEGTGVCTVWPGYLVRKSAGWQRGCWDCPRRVGCPQTKQWWGTVGCRLWSHKWGS